MLPTSNAESDTIVDFPGRRALRAKERRRTRLLAIPVVAATIGIVAAASIGAAAVTGAVDDGESRVPVVSEEQTEGVTYTVSGSIPGQLIDAREVPVVQTVGSGANGADAANGLAGVQWPVDLSKVTVTDGFGPRVSPCSGCSSNHRGLDLAGPQGTRIGSIANGIVIESVPTDSGGLGAHVVVEHRIDGLQVRSVYAHMIAGSPAAKVGDEVKVGQLVGLLGNTGASTGAHLHLEIIVDGTHVDPQRFLDKYADGKSVDIFGEVPVWNPPADGEGNQEGDGWKPSATTRNPDPTQVPEASPSPANPQPSTPAGETTAPSPSEPGPSTTPPGTTTEPTPSSSAQPTSSGEPSVAPSTATEPSVSPE